MSFGRFILIDGKAVEIDPAFKDHDPRCQQVSAELDWECVPLCPLSTLGKLTKPTVDALQAQAEGLERISGIKLNLNGLAERVEQSLTALAPRLMKLRRMNGRRK